MLLKMDSPAPAFKVQNWLRGVLSVWKFRARRMRQLRANTAVNLSP